MCFQILNDGDIFTDLSPSDVDMRKGIQDHYEEVFPLNNEEYKKWWDKLNMRTDISDDIRWEIQSQEDDFDRFLNIRHRLMELKLL